MTNRTLRIGLIGAGYIATWHADALRATPGVTVAAVCDTSGGAARGLARGHGAQVFADMDAMIAADACDAVHILTPPHLHHPLALQCLAGGLHVLVEKPVALSARQTQEIEAAAQKAGRRFAAGHNFLGLPEYERLKKLVTGGALGLVSHAQIDWALPLAPLRSGPFGLWLLAEPGNLLRELGPHPFSFAVDLFGPLEILALTLGHPIELPGGGTRHQGWRIHARAGRTEVSFNLSMVETHDDRSVTLRGSTGTARLDYGHNVLTISPDNTAGLIANPLLAELAQSWQHLREGVGNAGQQLRSLNRQSPYGLSFRGMNSAVYSALRKGTPADPRFSGASAIHVMQSIDDTLALMPAIPAPYVAKGKPRPRAMVIGGTGFVGRNLTRTLVARGQDVRVLSRGAAGPFGDIADHVDTVGVSLRDAEGLQDAMKGIDTVYNLAKSMDTTWADALENDVGAAVRVAEAAQAADVKRLVYTGTIASYDMSTPGAKITEDTSFGDITGRNIYARSKAECEARLMALHVERGLPLVIARPGIVVGHGGPLQHWGIGRWHGPGAVKLWGNGYNILPFVLSDDISDGLIRMAGTEAAIGQSFNLTGEPMLSGRAYFKAIHDRLGAQIRVSSGSLTAMWLADGVKYGLKRYALGRQDVVRPSLADWKSRGHLSRFDNSRPKQVLGWTPEAEIDAFVQRAIVETELFGF